MQNLIKGGIVIMKRERRITDLPLTECLIKELLVAKFLHLMIPVFSQRMQQIEIHMVCLQFLKLFIQNAHHVFMRIDCPAWKLGSKNHFLAITVLKRLANDAFTFSAMIRIRRINISDSAVDPLADHRYGEILVNLSLCCGRQTHATKAQCGRFSFDSRKDCFQHAIPS